jgi:hypothetical protein
MKNNSGKLNHFNETDYIHHNRPHTIAFLVIQDTISSEMITVCQETNECLWTVNLRKLVWYLSSCILCSKKVNPHHTMIRTTSVQTEIHIDIVIKNGWDTWLRCYKYVCKTDEIVLCTVQDNFSKCLQWNNPIIQL